MKKSSIGSSFFFEGFMKKWIWIVVLILIVILLLLLVWYFGFRNRVLVLPKQDTVLEIYEPIDLKDVISLEEGTVISKEYTPTSLGDVTVSFSIKPSRIGSEMEKLHSLAWTRLLLMFI